MHRLDTLNNSFPVRRTREQKEGFRKHILDALAKKNITARVERTRDGKNENIVIGDPTTAKAVFTAHYDTPAASLFPNVMIPRNLPLFFAYQFLPVILILAVSIGGAYAIAASMDGDAQAMMIAFLIIYYGLYFLGFRTFSNNNNANDNTSGVTAVLSIIDSLTEGDIGKVAFILFDNEEKGKRGSKAYFADHKDAMKDTFLLNFDCVGNGESFVFISMPAADEKTELACLRDAFASGDGFEASFYTKRGSESNSDYKSFPAGVGCMACKKSRRGLLYTPYIHTARDTVAKQENIDFIAERTVRFISKL